MTRKALFAHRQVCDEVTFECPFGFARCTARPRRNELDVHMHANAAQHLALLINAPAAMLVALLHRATAEPVKVAAANALRDLASDIDTMFDVMHEGAVTPLVALTTGCGTDTLKEAALGALRTLAMFDINQSRIMHEPHVIENLIALLSWGSDGVKEAAVDVLFNLGVGLFKRRIDGAATPLVALIHEGTGRTRDKAMKLLNNLCFDNHGMRAATMQAGAAYPLIDMLSGDETYACKELAACVLRNLAIEDDNTVISTLAGAVAPLVALLNRCTTDGCNEAAAGALANLAKNTDHHVTITRAGAIPLLVALRSGGGTEGVRETAEFTLWRLGVNADNEAAIAKAGGRVTRYRSMKRNRGAGERMPSSRWW